MRIDAEADYSTLLNTGSTARVHYMGPVYPQRGHLSVFDDGASAERMKTSGAAPAVVVGRWFHIALVHDGTTLRLFIDGQQRASAVTSRFPIDGNAPLGESSPVMQFGSTPRQDPEALAGAIDEIRISSGARYVANFTPAAHLAADVTTVALYTFDAGTGTTVASAASGGPTGTVVYQAGQPVPSYAIVSR